MHLEWALTNPMCGLLRTSTCLKTLKAITKKPAVQDAMATLQKLGAKLEPVDLPNTVPVNALNFVLSVEAAASDVDDVRFAVLGTKAPHPAMNSSNVIRNGFISRLLIHQVAWPWLAVS